MQDLAFGWKKIQARMLEQTMARLVLGLGATFGCSERLRDSQDISR